MFLWLFGRAIHWLRAKPKPAEPLPVPRFASTDELAAACHAALLEDKPVLTIPADESQPAEALVDEPAVLQTPPETEAAVQEQPLVVETTDALMVKCAEISAITGNITFGTRERDGTIKVFELR